MVAMTDMLQADVAVLKTDGVGRIRTPVARRESLLDEFERSGLSGPKFAALAGIKYQTLAGWARKRRGRGNGSRTNLVKPVVNGSVLDIVIFSMEVVFNLVRFLGTIFWFLVPRQLRPVS
jgi:hypothetical protein